LNLGITGTCRANAVRLNVTNGPSAFPAGRWIVVPALAAVMAWAAANDWKSRNPPEI